MAYPRLDITGLQELVTKLYSKIQNKATKQRNTDIFYGVCDTAAATQGKEATVTDTDGNFTLRPGVMVGIFFTYTNSYSATVADPMTLNVNGTGAKEIRGGNTSAAITGTNTTYFGRASALNYYMYNGTFWMWAGSTYDNNTTYSNVSLGQGYGVCSTAADTAAKTATITNYALVVGGMVTIQFTYAVPANATLNIAYNTTPTYRGAKAIRYKNAAITAGIINAGDTATFIYNGTYYILVAVVGASASWSNANADALFLDLPNKAGCTTTFPSGSICLKTYTTGETVNVTQQSDGSIKYVLTRNGNAVLTKVVSFASDGSVKETIS